MKIKTHRGQPALTSHLPAILKRRRLLQGTVLLCIAVTMFLLGAYLQSGGRLAKIYDAARQKMDIVAGQNVHLLSKTGLGMLARPPRLIIDIKFKHYQTLVKQRDRALASQVLIVTDDDFVPASVTNEGKTVPVNVRLKGDLIDHLKHGDKWSFRIKAKDEETLLGMKQFSLHHPTTRNYIYEWIYHQALRREDVIALRYDFVRVTLNGRDLGIYALEEHFEKRLVEHNRRREGPIIRFSEDRLFEEWRRQRIPFPGARQGGSGAYQASDIDAFQTQRWLADPEMRQTHDAAVSLLQAFRSGDRTTSEVFDMDRLAAYFAISDLLGAEHGTRWHNMRFYFNPITARLEPIGFDGDAGKNINELVYHLKDRHWSENAWTFAPDYLERLFDDQDFVTRYLAALNRVSQPEYLEQLFSGIEQELDQKLWSIYSEFPAFDFSREIFARNQKYIRSVIDPVSPLVAFTTGLRSDSMELNVGNLQAIPLDLVDVVVHGVTLPIDSDRATLAGRRPTSVVEYQTISVRFSGTSTNQNDVPADLKIRYRVKGTDVVRETVVKPWPFRQLFEPNVDVTRKKANFDDFDFIAVDDDRQVLSINRGNWTISKDLIIPPGYIVRCGPETQLHLTDSALIFSRSPIEFKGTEESPIVIDSPDISGQGLVVMDAGDRSKLEHVVFRRLSFASRPGWELTGAVTFYESPVEFLACRFLEAKAEDALNLFRCKFLVSDCLFADTKSDAFDADFCNGKIQRTRFSHCINDGIDVSGSHVELTDIILEDCGDKGISVGEASKVVATQIKSDRNRIGIAIKDASQLDADQVGISNTRIGIALYQKKSEFAGGQANITGATLQSVVSPWRIEVGSALTLNGVEHAGAESGLAAQLEPTTN